jgi:hypothetical protein
MKKGVVTLMLVILAATLVLGGHTEWYQTTDCYEMSRPNIEHCQDEYDRLRAAHDTASSLPDVPDIGGIACYDAQTGKAIDCNALDNYYVDEGPIDFVPAERCDPPGVRNCNQECQHLPSYPTYQKESCIEACIADSNNAQREYTACLERIPTIFDPEDTFDDEGFGEDDNATTQTAAKPPIDRSNLSTSFTDQLSVTYAGYLYAKVMREDEEMAQLYMLSMVRLLKQEAQRQGADESGLDVQSLLTQLEAEQTSMSALEQTNRLSAAKLAYQDLLLDQYSGVPSLDLVDKREEIKAEYGRILLFDPDNIEANKALGDMYRQEGQFQDSEVFYRRAIIHAARTDRETYEDIKGTIGSDFLPEVAQELGLSAPPTQSSFMSELGADFTATLRGIESDVAEEVRLAELLITSTHITISTDRVWDTINEVLFSVTPKKVEGLGNE